MGQVWVGSACYSRAYCGHSSLGLLTWVPGHDAGVVKQYALLEAEVYRALGVQEPARGRMSGFVEAKRMFWKGGACGYA